MPLIVATTFCLECPRAGHVLCSNQDPHRNIRNPPHLSCLTCHRYIYPDDIPSYSMGQHPMSLKTQIWLIMSKNLDKLIKKWSKHVMLKQEMVSYITTIIGACLHNKDNNKQSEDTWWHKSTYSYCWQWGTWT